MDRLLAMRVFVTVAEEGGLAPAARRLGSSPPAVTRAIAALEDHIGARLLERTTRLVRLTEAGARYLEDAKRILAEIDAAEAAASGAHVAVRGTLVITASILFGRKVVTPIVLDFLAAHPALDARTLLLDRVVDLVEEGVEVAVRVGELPDSSLHAIRVGRLRRVVCASRGYLEARGEPKTPGDLGAHEGLCFTGTPRREWTFTAHAPHPLPRVRLAANTADVTIEAAKRGLGVIRVLSYMVETELADGSLVRVLEAYEPPPVPVHLVYVGGRAQPARVRAFLDFAAARLRETPSIRET